MSLFSSAKERRLWAWTLAVVVAIYSTLGLARTLAGVLRDRDLIAASFALGMLLVAATIVALALKTRPGGVEIGVALGVACSYFMVLFRMAVPEERSHLIEYSVVTAHDAPILNLTNLGFSFRNIRQPRVLTSLQSTG